jgi:predicted dehydrogenase
MDEEAEIRIGLLGAGRWGQRYIETFKLVPGVRLTALASRNPASRSLVPEGCRISENWSDVVRGEDVDAVIVATPPKLHAEMADAALEAKKPVLVEKPFTLSVETAKALEQKSAARNVLLVVGHTQLYNVAFRKLKRSLPEIGMIRRIVCNAGNWGPFRQDVTALWDWGPHDVAMCLDVVEASPTRVSARVEAREQIEGGVGERYLIELGFPRNITAQIRVGNLVRPKRRRFEVQGEKGDLVFDDMAEQKLMRRLGSSERPVAHESELPLTTLVREFASAVRFGRRADSSLGLGREVVEILTRCDAQIRR